MTLLRTITTSLLVIGAMVCALPARAANYTFPGALPKDCSGSGGNYTCEKLKLEYNDTITIASPKPAKITVKGDLETDTSRINAGGSSADLTLTVSGRMRVKYQAVVVAHITAGSFEDVDGQATITGSITTGSGDIELRYATTVDGSLGSTSGRIRIGDSARVSGSVKTTSGEVQVDYAATIKGSLTTSNKVTLGGNVVIGGDIKGGSGDVTVGYGATLNGETSTTSGKITVDGNVGAACLRSQSSASITLAWATKASGVCCGSSCSNKCVTNNTGGTMPPACGSGSVATVDHYELQVPATAVACAASTVTVKACADSSSPCTNAATTIAGATATLAASVGTLAATTLTFDAKGTASTTWSHPGAAQGSSGTVTLASESTAATASRQCCPPGGACSTTNACSSSFSTAGFLIAAASGGAAATIPAQTAGTTSTGWVLRAVKTGTTTQACEAALTGSTTVDWALRCSDPSTCSSGNRMTLTGSSGSTIASNPASGVTSRTAVPMNFDANGNASFSFNYADVGQVQLSAQKSVGGATLSGSSNAFVVKPASFSVTSVRQSASPNTANPGATGATGGVFVKAGEAFSATVTALTSSGAAAANFGREASPEGVTLSAALLLPAGGTLGTLGNATITGGSFSGGVATVTTLSYGEVGTISLTPAVADGNYLGEGHVGGTPASPIGRFVPARLALSKATITHRSSTGCSPASAFTYLGENFRVSFTLTAQNAAGATTTNYAGTWARLDPTTADWRLAGRDASTVFTTANGRLAMASSTGAWTAGVADGITVTAAALRAASPDGPFAATFGVAPVDGDGVALASLDFVSTVGGSADRAGLGTVALRFGRLRLSSATGAADRALSLPASLQHWDGSAWVTNTLDSCTVVPTTAVSFGNLRRTLTTADTAVTSALRFIAGSGALRLAAPAGGRSGTVDVALSLGSTAADASCLQPWKPGTADAASAGAGLAYLRAAWCGATWTTDPSARAAFGLPRMQDHLIYRREMY